MPEKTPSRALDTGLVWSPCMSRPWGCFFFDCAGSLYLYRWRCSMKSYSPAWASDSYGAQCQAISRRTSNIGHLQLQSLLVTSTHVNPWQLKTFSFSIVKIPKPVIILIITVQLPYFSGVSLGVSLVHSIQSFPHRPLNTARFSGAPCRPPNWRRPWWIWNGASERCRWGSYGTGLEIARIIPKCWWIFPLL